MKKATNLDVGIGSDLGIMIDLETLGTSPNTMIATIGAIAFDNKSGKHIGQPFYAKIDLNSYKKYGVFSFDAETLSWWMEQGDGARKEAFCGNNRVKISQALQEFISWYGNVTYGAKKVYIWSHGASFDIPILSFALKTVEMDIPWQFWNIRCTRTLFDNANFDYRTVGSVPLNGVMYPTHHALGDCAKQIEGVRICKNILVTQRF